MPARWKTRSIGRLEQLGDVSDCDVAVGAIVARSRRRCRAKRRGGAAGNPCAPVTRTRIRHAPLPAVISVLVIRLHPAHQLAHAGPGARRVVGHAPQLLAQAPERHRRARLAGQADGDADVLEHQLQLERVVEAAADDALAQVRLRHPRHAGRAVEHVDHRRRVEAVALADRQTLGNCQQVHRRDQVVEALHRVAGAERAEVEHRLAMRSRIGRTRSRSPTRRRT